MWQPGIICLHVVSDGLIALAYYSIPLTLVYFVTRRKDLVFDWIFLCFAAFIVACGTTHAMEIVNIWHPTYWLSGLIKAITATLSIVTAILLVRLVPKALALPSPDQLRAANEELHSQTAKLEAANHELEAFTYSVSHDLRAPLRHIDGYLDLLRQETKADPETRQRYMNVVTDSAHRMSLLIDNLLDFSRMGRAALRLLEMDAGETVAEARRELARETDGRNIAWNIGVLPRIRVDPVLFKQVWINLLHNAIKYTSQRERAEITVACRETAKEFEFSIRDNGAGFDMQYADKLFGIFQRLHGTEEFEGTGIGLANVRRIVTRHGGRIWAEGRVDAGATFFFTIPKSSAATSS